MFSFVLQKIKSKKWLILSLFIGNILLIGIVASNFIYSQAVLQNALETEMSTYLTENNIYPGNIRLSTTVSKDSKNEMEAMAYVQDTMGNLSDETGVNSSNIITEMHIRELNLDLENGDGMTKTVTLQFLSDMEEHSKIIYGEMYTNELEPDGSIGVVVSESTLIRNDLLVGETYKIKNLKNDNKDPYHVTIKGIFENNSDSDMYWVTSPSDYIENLFMDEDLLKELFIAEKAKTSIYLKMINQLDFTDIKSEETSKIIDVLKYYTEETAEMKDMYFVEYCSEILSEHYTQTQKLNITLLVLQVPIFVLLAAFIFMVSKQILELEQSEISIFKSRGASKRQIIRIYLIQSGIICSASLILGIPFGYLICQILGSSNAFLEFVNRTNLPASINFESVIFSLVAAAFSAITMVVPVFKYADVGIVASKRKKQQKIVLKWWEKIGLDVICIAVSLYGLYSVNKQKEFIIELIAKGESVDPVTFLYSSLFIIGVGLFALRLFPWVVKLIFIIGKRFWSCSAYVSFKKVISSNGNQGFIMLFMILTISLGIFNAVTARTINSNEEKNISYNGGAQVVLKEIWKDNSDDETTSLMYTEPDYGKYSEIEGVSSYTKVYVDEDIKVETTTQSFENTTLMSINTKEFGETAWFDTSLLPYHWYEYLNAISQNPEAILMSSNAKEAFDLKVGDSITYYNASLETEIRGVIYAFVDYWPTYNPFTTVLTKDGSMKEINHYLIVSSLSQVQSVMGVSPYEVWLKMNDSTSSVYDFAIEKGLEYEIFEDTNAKIIEQKKDPIFQGTNGILTVGFITVLSLCMVGFLIYWILSIISRQLQFGIFRAMGMSMKEVVLMLVNEQLWVSGYSILVGTIVGILTSILYVPIIGITYTASDQALPMEIIFNMSDYGKIFIVVGLMIAICMTVLYTMIAKLKITQVLKLGED